MVVVDLDIENGETTVEWKAANGMVNCAIYPSVCLRPYSKAYVLNNWKRRSR